MEQEVVMEAFGIECTDRGVVADLLGYESEPQVFPRYKNERERREAGETEQEPR